jgi:hypothetical protein
MSTTLAVRTYRSGVSLLLIVFGVLTSPLIFADNFVVTNTTDAAAGSLRAAIIAANADVTPPHNISFNIAGTGPFTIVLASALPSITQDTDIDASTEAISGAPGVRLDGSALVSGNGLTFSATADGSSVAYLSITGFPGYGIDIASDSTIITFSYIGVLPDGTTADGNALAGVRLNSQLSYIGTSTSTGNLISGNEGSGISVIGGAFSFIRGNRIGTNATGTAAIPNLPHGISGGGASGTTVGGNDPGQGNLISGNQQNGIVLGSSSTFWGVHGNFLGLNASGTAALPNGQSGLNITGDNHLIGGTDPDGRNIISGNTQNGILLFTGANSNTITGNYIGTNPGGTAAVGTQPMGIRATGTVDGLAIGGNVAAARNVISGNSGWGISVESATLNVTVYGNYIGTNAAGTAAIANNVGISFGGTGNRLGGDTAGERNIISGNTSNGVSFAGTSNYIQGNYIGLNAAGTAAIGNGGSAIRAFAAIGGSIGGTVAGEGNVISGNSGDALALESESVGLTVAGNFIGTNPGGTAIIANGGGGVRLNGTNNLLGGSTAAARNIISGNVFGGVGLYGSGNGIKGNYIGLDVTGTVDLGNGSNGIRALASTSGIIGGSAPGEGNVISGNASSGIVLDSDVSGTVIQGNRIGTNAAGTAVIANDGGGVGLNGTNNTLGGSAAGARNIISGNVSGGVSLYGSANAIKGNYIGLDITGAVDLGNGGIGIRAIGSTSGIIGGSAAGEGNVISGNASSGVVLDGDVSGTLIQGNRIGTNATGTAAIPNGQSGVGFGGSNNTLGGSTVGARNLVSGNLNGGIVFSGINNTVRGNYIGINAAGSAALGNGSYGIRGYNATGGEIGGPAVADGNVVAGNERSVSLEFETTGVTIRNNIIGLDATATVNLTDNGTGIEVDADDNIIGTPGAGNVIAGMAYYGIGIGSNASGNLIQGNWLGTNKALVGGLGNTYSGIWAGDAWNNTIGGTEAGQGNIVMNNGFMGVRVERGDGNEVSGNSIYNNGLLGLDVGLQYVFPNDDLDPDIIGNRAQNFPLLTLVTVNGGSTHFEGLIRNEPETAYRVEFFSSPACDDTGMGEGRTFIGTANVLTDLNGQATVVADIGVPVADAFASATVTDPAGNTSEFSPCAQVGAANPGKIQFFRNVYLAYKGIINTGEVILVRSHGMSGSVSVTFTISNNTALAGTDYVDSDQVVTFLANETVKVIHVPVLVDLPGAPNPENALLALSSPTGGATLGVSASELLIFDEDITSPGIAIDDAEVTEGNSGQKLLTFDVHLSATDHPVTVTYLSETGSATEGTDYVHVEGEIDFGINASQQTQQVSIPINGDAVGEPDEVVWMRITSAANGGNWIAYKTYGAGLIINDDGAVVPDDGVFKDGFENPP